MVDTNRRFVYGRFHWLGMKSWSGLAEDRIALGIVREYGANELIGKIYLRVLDQWLPVDPSRAPQLEWFKWYEKMPANVRTNAKAYYFDMEGSGHWSVLHFRNESDETGPYVAVALRYSG